MRKKKASEIKLGDKIVVAGEILEVNAVEISDIGKQGSKKVRFEAKKTNGENVVIIRPADYPIETK